MAVRRRTAAGERDRLLPVLSRRLARLVDGFFRSELRRLEPGLRSAIADLVPTKVDAALVDECEAKISTLRWDAERRELLRIVRPFATVAAESAFEAVGREIGVSIDFDLNARPLRQVVDDVATEIRGVTETSRRRIAREIAEGIEKGLSVEEIVRGVRPGTQSVRGPRPAFRGIAGLVDSWTTTGVGRFAGATGTVPFASSRAYLVALTETGNAYNRSSIVAYGEAGVGFVEVFDGPDCGWESHDSPDLAHGSIRPLAAARARPLSHPRCQRAFGARLDANRARPSPFASGRGAPGSVPGATPGIPAVRPRT